MNIPLPITWKSLNIKRYDDTSDPDEHLDTFTTQINLYSNEKIVLCKVFPTSLKGLALMWCKRLPPWSIDSFITLAQLFGAQYATSCPHHTTFVALVNLRQANDESLQSFMERYIVVSVKIRDLNPSVTLYSMITTLKLGLFIDSLFRKQPKDLDELRARATGYIQMEEFSDFCNQICFEGSSLRPRMQLT